MAPLTPTRSRSLRARLVALTAVAVIVPLLIGIFVLATLLQRSLTGSLTSRVKQQTDIVAITVRDNGPQSIRLADTDRPMKAVVLSANGKIVAAQPRDVTLPLSGDRPETSHKRVQNAQYWWRPGDVEAPLVVSRSVQTRSGRYVVQVSSSQQPQHEAISTVVKILLLGTPLLALLAAALAWLVAGRSLAPVDRMRSEVDAIEAGHLDARVVVPGQDDEISALARTLNRMLDRLESSQERQQRFVADASHELRSPLATLQAATDLTSADPGGEWPAVESTVRAELGRMNALIGDLLLLARIEEDRASSPTTDVDLDDIAQAEVSRWRSDTNVVVRYAGTPARARVLESSVERIVRNLVDNGIRHADGQVLVTTSRDSDGSAVLTVDDDGAGIDPGDRERVFDRFVRLDEGRSRGEGGFGLGLAIVRELARSTEGDVRVESAPLGGARFVVTLPGAQEASSR
ncbi:two-component sensor histidine kinase [Flexivirga endophytica]|uniref:histidine kinase n=1 Tax=Flexivirga endophytica TaxID=1849103 RepID=A0A916T578_9MICO|nr:HAMP domain-containing sensor histidine kinase [Flexivirga endophytica]GGB31304.1 two-component sensor histidine kinase [Flexivirga endophytica]GHB52248.1 two-component sensor histidine kinase [Flexivirga endophytica]